MALDEVLKRSLIVIPSINGGRLLQRMLPTLQVPPDIVVVIDQGSTDNTEEVCARAGVEIVQLGRAHTYTQACNLGAKLARERGADYLFVANNDITFTTDVARELLAEMLDDPLLGIVAPSQIIVNEITSERLLAYRVFWYLERLVFQHDFTAPVGDPRRLEADFCELTFALVRMAAIDAIGFLDDDFGFYHEDADFCFRLRQAGFASAYAPRSQIEHFAGSTFVGEMSETKRAYLQRNKFLFAKKHLGYGVKHQDHKSDEPSSWNIINKYLHPELRRFGLVDDSRPELIFSHPGTEPYDYLYSVWETTKLPNDWLKFNKDYKAVFAPSVWNFEVLQNHAFENVSYVPLGIDTDRFNPWGPAQRIFEGRTYLWFSNNQKRKGLDAALLAWSIFFAAKPIARLVIMGHGILKSMRETATQTRRWKNFSISEYVEAGIIVFEITSPIPDEVIPSVYRSVDFTLSSSHSEGFGFTVAESLACGVPAIFGDYGATRDFKYDGALTYRGKLIPADYSDKGFVDVGEWWAPDIAQMAQLLQVAYSMEPDDYRRLSEAGVRLIRQRFTWRHTVFAIRAALATLQQQNLPAGLEQKAAKAMAPVQYKSRSVKKRRRWARRAMQLRQFSGVVDQWAGEWEARGSRAALGAAGPAMASFLGASLLAGPVKGGRKLFDRLSRLSRNIRRAVFKLRRRRGVLFIGYVEAALGIGEASRGMISAAAAANLSYGVYPFQVGVETRRIGPFMPEKYDRTHVYDVNVIEVAPDQAPIVFGALDSRLYKKSYNVLRTAWELPEAPQEWAKMLAGVDEIWTPTRFVAQAFRGIFEGPIRLIPHTIEPDVIEPANRRDFGLEVGRFYFLYSFDYYSFPARKNPLGVLEAFQKAFPDAAQNVGLVLKSTGAVDHHPAIKATILAASRADPRIKVLDATMSRSQVLGLIQCCDAYVSLHRAEGFGLGMAEAMFFGKSVIATNYSGNTDFLTQDTGFPVDYRLRALRPDEYVWSQGQVWAEPDMPSAIAAMQAAYGDPPLREQRAQAGAALMREKFSRAAVGRLVKTRIDEILAARKK